MDDFMLYRRIATITAAVVILIGGFFLANTFRHAPIEDGGQNNQPLALKLPVALVQLDGATPSNDPAVLSHTNVKFGCNDEIVYVNVSRSEATGDLPADLLYTLMGLKYSDPTQPFYNALDDATLKVTSTVKDGKTTVALEGQLNQGGVCDSPRIKEQIEQTLRYNGITNFAITLNGSEAEYRCIGDESGTCK